MKIYNCWWKRIATFHFNFDVIFTVSVADDADLLEPAFIVVRIFNDQRTAAVILLDSDRSNTGVIINCNSLDSNCVYYTNCARLTWQVSCLGERAHKAVSGRLASFTSSLHCSLLTTLKAACLRAWEFSPLYCRCPQPMAVTVSLSPLKHSGTRQMGETLFVYSTGELSVRMAMSLYCSVK